MIFFLSFMYQQSEERTVLAISGVTIYRKHAIIFQKTPGNLNQNLTSKISTNHQQSKQPKERFPIGRYWVLLSVINSTCNKIILVFLKMTNLLSSH